MNLLLYLFLVVHAVVHFYYNYSVIGMYKNYLKANAKRFLRLASIV